MVESFDAAGVSITRRETTTYEYDATGIRVSSTQETDADGDGAGGSTVTTTTYLSDPQNPTGYAGWPGQSRTGRVALATRCLRHLVTNIGNGRLSVPTAR